MVVEVLSELGAPMEPRQIADAIRKRWWPDMPGNRVNTIVYKMKKDGRLENIEGTTKYRVPQKDEAPDGNSLGGQPSGASNVNPDPEAKAQKPGHEVGHDNMT